MQPFRHLRLRRPDHRRDLFHRIERADHAESPGIAQNNLWLILLISAVIALVLGTGLTASAVYITMVATVVPLLKAAGVPTMGGPHVRLLLRRRVGHHAADRARRRGGIRPCARQSR